MRNSGQRRLAFEHGEQDKRALAGMVKANHSKRNDAAKLISHHLATKDVFSGLSLRQELLIASNGESYEAKKANSFSGASAL
jgi:hypothetical protein